MDPVSRIIVPLFITVVAVSEAHPGGPYFTDVTSTHLPASLFGRNMGATVADFNGDGRPEILVAREFQSNGFFFNDGQGRFADSSAGRFPLPAFDSEEVVVADFNVDGFPDIVFASEDNMVHEYYLNNGDNTFSDVSRRLPQSVANAVIAIDLNGDGAPDLVFGNTGQGTPPSPGQNLVLINNGDGTFADSTSSWLPDRPDATQDLAFADIDGDDDLDLIVGNEDGNRILIREGNRFVDQTDTRLPVGNEETRKVSTGDVDGDGDIDLYFSNVMFVPGRNPQDRLLINDGHGVFTDETALRLPAETDHTTDAAFLDVDLDGDLDLVTANVFFNRPVRVLLNDSTGTFVEGTSAVFPPGVTAEGLGIIVADFNGDGYEDLFIVNRRTPQQPTTHDWLLFRNVPPTGVPDWGATKGDFHLGQNFPNPFNPVTTFEVFVARAGNATLTVYDILGREVETLFNTTLNPGKHVVSWDATRHAGGIYLYRLTGDHGYATGKMTLLK